LRKKQQKDGYHNSNNDFRLAPVPDGCWRISPELLDRPVYDRKAFAKEVHQKEFT